MVFNLASLAFMKLTYTFKAVKIDVSAKDCWIVLASTFLCFSIHFFDHLILQKILNLIFMSSLLHVIFPFFLSILFFYFPSFLFFIPSFLHFFLPFISVLYARLFTAYVSLLLFYVSLNFNVLTNYVVKYFISFLLKYI